ncbi:uridine kinase [Deinococcus metallilatus]|uniref:Uridine kinase n=1 Tax=Deinococcus metallilatus TaxID=1211322 RepID=A0ABR6MQW2_9DEIO|nr:uridine kinase [Deinococcus metallilatus]MBB5294333.1 uridine kinase [Deinococcus metallilatus]GMA16330.1 uridine kinase [Deinococcus metallilatus]
MNRRAALLHALAGRLDARPARPVLRVAVDGVDGAGKTTFADELAEVLRERDRTVIRASVDGFHAPRAVRYRLGRTSPEGFYRDSYDYPGLRAALLDPLGPGGSRRYRTAIFDHATDAPVETPERVAAEGSILILDGLFLHRSELRDVWDDSVFLHVAFAVSVPRGAARGPGYGSPDLQAESNRRYVEGNRLYFREAQPQRYAGVVVDNNDLEAPFIVEGPLAS